MTKRDERAYIGHILDAISRAESYVAGLDYQAFQANHLVQDGVIRQLEIIGEAAKCLSDETRSRAPGIPWKDMAGMRDKLIHQYFGVDIEAVWETIVQDLPILKQQISHLLI